MATRMVFGLFVLLAAMPTKLLATPVQVIECNIYTSQGPLPFEYVDSRYTIRRHISHTAPNEVLVTDFWSQGIFTDNGYFELTVYPFGEPPRTETSNSVQSTILDGFGTIGDRYLDQALTMNKTITYEGYTLDSIGIRLDRDDGSAIEDHASVPIELHREDWDPYTCQLGGCDRECVVTWRAPGDGVPCAVGGSGGGNGLCPTGSYLGQIASITFEDHEADHGAGFAINAGLNDAWVTAQAPFQGLFVTVYEDLGLVFVAWFTFEASAQEGETTTQSLQSGLPAVFGAEDQRWVTAVGAYSGDQASLNLELTTGGLFNASEPLPTQDTDYGTLDLEFSDCSNGAVTFNVPAAGLSGSFPITRVLEENATLCEELTNP